MDDRLDTFHIGSWAVIYRICHCHYNLLEPVPLTLEPATPAHLPLPEQRRRDDVAVEALVGRHGSSRPELTHSFLLR